jgi:hypothetical protein
MANRKTKNTKFRKYSVGPEIIIVGRKTQFFTDQMNKLRFACRTTVNGSWKRPYYSHTVIPGLNRKQQWPMQSEIPKGAPASSGYNYVMQRLSNMTISLTEKQPSKALHIFPESSYAIFMGNVSLSFVPSFEYIFHLMFPLV